MYGHSALYRVRQVTINNFIRPMIDESDSNKNKINICTMVVTTNKKETTTTTSSTITIVSPPNTCRFNKVVVPDTDVGNIKAYKVLFCKYPCYGNSYLLQILVLY